LCPNPIIWLTLNRSFSTPKRCIASTMRCIRTRSACVAAFTCRRQEIARLVGHATTRTTEIVYRRELRPVITTGAEIMDQLCTGT
jgi:hypothetical protein